MNEIQSTEKIPKYHPPPQIKGMDFSKEKIEQVNKEHRLLILTIFTSARCDLKCPYCYVSGHKLTRKSLKNELTLPEYKKILKWAKELGTETIWLPGAGEPLILKEFKELVDYICELDMNLIMFTDNTHITEEVAKWLLERKISVYAKLNSFHPKIQDQMVGVKGAHIKIYRGLYNLLGVGYNKTKEYIMGIETVITPINLPEIVEIFEWARDNHIIPFIELPMYWKNGEFPEKMKVKPEEAKEIFNQLLSIDRKKYGFTWIPHPPYVASQCDKYGHTLAIDSQGDVHPCAGADLINLGNIREKSLKEIWENPGVEEKYCKKVYENLEGKCGTCPIHRRYGCYGCRGHALRTTKNLYGPDLRCWHNIKERK